MRCLERKSVSHCFIGHFIQEEMLKELDEMHSKQELQVMDMFHDVEKTIEKIEDGTKFAERVVEHASGAELLSMKKMITMQLMSLINNTPKPDVNIKLDFITDQTKFEEAMKETFGSFAKPDQDAKVSDLPISSCSCPREKLVLRSASSSVDIRLRGKKIFLFNRTLQTHPSQVWTLLRWAEVD